MINSKTENGIDPLVELLVQAGRALGAKAWVGFPPPEEMAKLKLEKQERDFEMEKRRHEARERAFAEMRRQAMQIIRAKMESQQ